MTFSIGAPAHKPPQIPRLAGDPGRICGFARRTSLRLAIVTILLMSVVSALCGSARAQTACDPNAQQLIVYHAGSLTASFTALEQLFTQETGVCVTDVAAGSVDAARRVTAGQQPCDIFASADYMIIDRFLKPAGYADFDLLFGQTSMVLAYTTASKGAGAITNPGASFAPPDSIPDVADNWYEQLVQPGVLVVGSHPFLDPSGYRADMIFQLAEKVYRVPNLYDTLLQHYSITRSTDALGQTYDYGVVYEFSTLSAYKANPSAYRFARLPAPIGLSEPRLNPLYGKAAVIMPGLRTQGSAPFVSVNGSRVVFGVTILRAAPNPGNAIKFLGLLFSDRGVALQEQSGPTPISPPLVSGADMASLPQALRSAASLQP